METYAGMYIIAFDIVLAVAIAQKWGWVYDGQAPKSHRPRRMDRSDGSFRLREPGLMPHQCGPIGSATDHLWFIRTGRVHLSHSGNLSGRLRDFEAGDRL